MYGHAVGEVLLWFRRGVAIHMRFEHLYWKNHSAGEPLRVQIADRHDGLARIVLASWVVLEAHFHCERDLSHPFIQEQTSSPSRDIPSSQSWGSNRLAGLKEVLLSKGEHMRLPHVVH